MKARDEDSGSLGVIISDAIEAQFGEKVDQVVARVPLRFLEVLCIREHPLEKSHERGQEKEPLTVLHFVDG